jgi:hypothetical protein
MGRMKTQGQDLTRWVSYDPKKNQTSSGCRFEPEAVYFLSIPYMTLIAESLLVAGK